MVVDVDLEKFFDRVNHDILMDRLAKRIADKTVLRLIRSYLQAGIMANGVVMDRSEGTPQGGLSPLLANVLLDEVDRDLQRRGHRFARYADDCNVYVRSQKAGERGIALAEEALRQAPPEGERRKPKWDRSLAASFLATATAVDKGHGKDLRRAQGARHVKQRIRLIQVESVAKAWLRSLNRCRHTCRAGSPISGSRRPRKYSRIWTHGRATACGPSNPQTLARGTTVYSRLRALGATHELAAQIAGGAGHWWGHSEAGLNRVLTVKYFDELGIPRLT